MPELTKQEKEIFEKLIQNYSTKEIAQTFGMTTKGVEYHIGQTLKKLHTNLKDYIPLLIFLSRIN